MKRLKQLLSCLLVFAMVSSIAPTVAFAADDDNTVAYTVEGGNIYFDTSTGTITDCDKSVTQADIPNKINGIDVQCVAMYAFAECTNLENVSLPNSIKTIKMYAFQNCSKLDEISLPKDLVKLEACAFAHSGLAKISIPHNITNIEQSVFWDCTNLTDVTFPESLKSIGWYAFKDCTKLNNIKIPDSATVIDLEAFYNCTSLTTLKIENASIGSRAFANCTNLHELVLGNGTQTEYGAFTGCTNIKKLVVGDKFNIIPIDNYSNLESLTTGKNITYIGTETFKNCTKLTDINLQGITEIASSAFENCNNLVNANLPNIVDIGECAFKGCSQLKTLTLPDSTNAIGQSAFENCTSLTKINVPDGVKTITAQVFSGCTSLEQVDIPDSITSIEDYAFYKCSSLKTLNIPNNVSNLGHCAFYETYGLTTIKIGDGVTSEDIQTAFDFDEKYTNLKSIRFGKNVKTSPEFYCDNLQDIDWGGVTCITRFKICNGLTDLEIPSSIDTIMDYAFSGCANLTNVKISGNALNAIGVRAFEDCIKLSSITIPASVTTIGDSAFENCNSLTDVYYGGSESDWQAISGSGKPFGENTTIHYNSTGSNLPTDNNTYVRFFSSWNAEKRTIDFDCAANAISPNSYTVADTVNTDNFNDLVNHYVLVTTKQGDSVLDYIVTDIQPVESAIGSVTSIGENSLTIGNTTYPVRSDFVFGNELAGQNVLYHLYAGTIVGLMPLKEKVGTLESWNGTDKIVRISGTTYPLSPIADLSFLANIDQKFDSQVSFYTYADTANAYQPIFSIAYCETGTGLFSHYDLIDNQAYIDGIAYDVDSSQCTPNTETLHNKRVFFLQKGNRIVHIDALENIVPTLSVDFPHGNQITYIYEKGKYQNVGAGQQIEANIFYKSNYKFPAGYSTKKIFADTYFNQSNNAVVLKNVEWENLTGFTFRNGNIAGQSLKVGETKSITLTVYNNGQYHPNDDKETLQLKFVVNAQNGTSCQNGLSIVIQNRDYQSAQDQEISKEVESAADQLSKIPWNNCVLNPEPMYRVFGIEYDELSQFEQELLTCAVMSNIPKKSLDARISDEVLEKIFGKYKVDLGANGYSVPLTYVIDTPKYGKLTVCFTLHISSFDWSGKRFGLYADISYEVTKQQGGASLPPMLKKNTQLGQIAITDISAFANSAYNAAEKELKKAYDEAWGNNANQVASIIFSKTVQDILNANNTKFSKKVWDLLVWPAKNVKNACPTNVYIYNQAGELCGAIENNVITKQNGDFTLRVKDDVKFIDNLDDSYQVKYVATNNGTMDVEVVEFLSYGQPLRVIGFSNVPLSVDKAYSQGIPTEVFASAQEYILRSETNTSVSADIDQVLVNHETEEKQAYVITFETNGGELPSAMSTAVADQAGKLSYLPTPTYDGYVFSGWYTLPDTGDKVTEDTIFNKDTTIYAHWTRVNGTTPGTDSGSTSSSGGNGITSGKYTVSITTVENGKISVSPSTAKKGDAVTISVAPDTGYKLDKLTVTDSKGNTLTVSDKGNGKYTFIMPDSKVTVTSTFVSEATKPAETRFVDVADNAWYAEAVNYVADKGMMNGIGENKFAPNATTTRGMLMTVLARYAGQDTSDSNPWYQKGMDWAVNQKVSDGTNPTVNITREQLVTMLYRYAGSPVASGGSLSDFSDTAAVSDYAVSAMQWAVTNSIVNGANGKLNPKNNATRAEVAAILMRFCEMNK